MTGLRFFFILLFLLNILAFTAIQGWLGKTENSGEPERLTNQLNPDAIRLQNQDTATAALTSSPESPVQPDEPDTPPSDSESTLCMRWTQLSAEDAQKLETLITTAGYKPKRESNDIQSAWWVRIPPQGGRDLAEKKTRELRELGITDFFIVQDPGANQYAVSLGLFKSETSANQHLAQLRSKGVRTASIAPRYNTQYSITLDATAAYFKALEKSFSSTHRTPCQP